MRKLPVLGLFVALALVALGAGISLHVALASAGYQMAGWAVEAVVLALVGVCSVGCFSPNAPIFGRVIAGRGVTAPIVALTFDDGPSPDTTPRILDTLRQAGARASFFVLGRHAERHPELVARMVREGHEVASHGWTHGILVFAGPSRIRQELQDTERILTECGAPKPTLFRAPHGFRGPLLVRIAGKLGYRLVGWSKGVFDTALPGPEVIAERSIRALHPGAILLFHDADGNGDGDRSQTAEALPAILQAVKAKGLDPVTVSELASAARPPSYAIGRAALGAIAVATVLAALVWKAGVGTIGASFETLAHLNPALVGAAVLANLASIVLKATVWKASLDSLPKPPPVRYRHILASIFIGFLMNSILVARAGELGRAVVLRRRTARDSGVRLPISTIVSTMFVETIVLAVTFMALLAVSVFAVPGTPDWAAKGIVLVLVGVAALALWFLAVEVASHRLRRRRMQRPDHEASSWGARIVREVDRVIHELRDGHRLFTDPRRAGLALGAGLGSWIANLVAIWLMLLAFGIGSNAFAAAITVFAVSNLVGLVQVTPGNLGIFQVAIAVALTQAYGVDHTLGIGFGVGLQAIEVGLGAGLGLVFLAYEGLGFAELRREAHAQVWDTWHGGTTRPDAELARASAAATSQHENHPVA